MSPSYKQIRHIGGPVHGQTARVETSKVATVFSCLKPPTARKLMRGQTLFEPPEVHFARYQIVADVAFFSGFCDRPF